MRFNFVSFSKLFLISLCSLFMGSVVAREQRNPQPIEPGLNDKMFARALCQSDFDSGTFRITEPGCYYLHEDILFDPLSAAEAARTDKPCIGWFAVISIETENVTLDLNTKSIAFSEDYLAKKDIKLSSVIQLANAIFCSSFGAIETINPLTILGYKGDTEYHVANNVVIRNGTIGRTSLSGIGGFDNHDIALYDLVIKDWENVGILLPGLEGGRIEHVCITGLEHQQQLDYKRAVAEFTLRVLKCICDKDPKARTHICALEEELKRPREPLLCAQGTNFSSGIFLGAQNFGSTLPAPCPDDCTVGDCFDHVNCVCIKHSNICDIELCPLEVVCVKSRVIIPRAPCCDGPTLIAGIYVLDWLWAFSPVCDSEASHFQPSALFKAQVYLISKLAPSLLPPGFLDNILRSHPDEMKFLMSVAPCFGHDIFGLKLQGVWGIHAFPKDLCIENTHISDIVNASNVLGTTVCDIPRGDCFATTTFECPIVITCDTVCAEILCSVDPVLYQGNDVGGILLHSSKASDICNANISSIESFKGSAFGISIRGNLPFDTAKADKICNTCVSSVSGDFDRAEAFADKLVSSLTSVVNPSSSAYGYHFLLTDGTLVNDSIASCIEAPRRAYGFADLQTQEVLIQGSKAFDITVDSEFVDNAAEFKRAVGFMSLAGRCNQFRNDEAYNVRIEAEIQAPHTSSRAAGFLLGGTGIVSEAGITQKQDEHGLIDHSLTRCNFGGAGLVAGILLYDTLCAAVFDSETSANDALDNGLAYGLLDVASGTINPVFAACSDSLILRNLAFNNKTLNYLVKFCIAGQALPLSRATFGNVQSLYCANPWDNILLEKAPGKEQDPRVCKRIFSKLVSCPC